MPNKRLTRMVRVGAVALALIGLSASVAVASTTGPSDQQRLRLATDRFHSVAAAEKHGYAKFSDVNGISCIAEPGMGAMGIHYVDGALVGDPAEALRRPEAMVYAPGPDGKLRLAAVEYIVLKSDGTPRTRCPRCSTARCS